MTFLERYEQEETWYGKVIVIEIFHLVMTRKEKGWTVTKTAECFGLSIGLVSENLRIANAMHKNERIINAGSRQKALRMIGG